MVLRLKGLCSKEVDDEEAREAEEKRQKSEHVNLFGDLQQLEVLTALSFDACVCVCCVVRWADRARCLNRMR